MHLPPAFVAADPLAVVRDEPFAVVLSTRSTEVAHVPLVIRDAEPLVLLGHVAAVSPLAKEIAGGTELLAIFSGVHGYVSPRDYATSPHVPTWNYVATHVRGQTRLLEGDAALDVLDRLATRFEPEGGWSRRDVPDAFVRNLLHGIVAFELHATEVVGKAKLSQNRTRADRDAAIAAIEARHPQLAHAMRTAAS